jgi:hypothetical protein
MPSKDSASQAMPISMLPSLLTSWQPLQYPATAEYYPATAQWLKLKIATWFTTSATLRATFPIFVCGLNNWKLGRRMNRPSTTSNRRPQKYTEGDIVHPFPCLRGGDRGLIRLAGTHENTKSGYNNPAWHIISDLAHLCLQVLVYHTRHRRCIVAWSWRPIPVLGWPSRPWAERHRPADAPSMS